MGRRWQHGVLRYLVRWRGYTSAGDTRLRLDEPAHCQEKVAEHDTAAVRLHRVAAFPATSPTLPHGAAGPAPLPAPPPPSSGLPG